MSNLWINIRFGTRHLQLSRDWKWAWKYNPVHAMHDSKWFAIYEFPGLNKFLNG